jgi:hypothetical protein
LSSSFYFGIRKIFKKIQNIIKISRIFHPKFLLFFFLKYVNKNEKNSHSYFFMHVYIFSERCLKNHNMFICHFLSTYFRNIMKNFSKSSPKFFINAFLKGKSNIVSKLLMKFTTLACDTGLCHLARNL